MHSEILTEEQKKLLPLVKSFSNQFGLVGGTAIGLLLGHRRSIDFDLFSRKTFYPRIILDAIREKHTVQETFVENPHELTVLVNGIKMTFYKYVFDIKYPENFNSIIKLPNLLTLAAMKAHALGGRAKWKDYVDLYFIFQKHSLREVCDLAQKTYGGEFNEKLFREQLAYYDDVNYTEKVVFLKGFSVSDQAIKDELTKNSLQE